MTPREQIEKASEAFIEAYLSDSRDFLACEKHHRKRLLSMDLYEVEDVYEKAMKAGYNLAVEKVIDWLCRNMVDTDYWCINAQALMSKPELINNLKQEIKL